MRPKPMHFNFANGISKLAQKVGGWGGGREPNNRRLNDVVRPGAGFDSIHFEPDKGCVAALVQWEAVKIYHVASSV